MCIWIAALADNEFSDMADQGWSYQLDSWKTWKLGTIETGLGFVIAVSHSCIHSGLPCQCPGLNSAETAFPCAVGQTAVNQMTDCGCNGALWAVDYGLAVQYSIIRGSDPRSEVRLDPRSSQYPHRFRKSDTPMFEMYACRRLYLVTTETA